MKSRTLIALVVLVVLIVLAPALAFAQTPQEGGKQHFLAGVEQFKQKHYLQALSEFEGSYKLNPVAGVLFNIALTQKELGRNRDALATFDHYVIAAGANMNVAQRGEVDKQMAALQAKLAMVKLEVASETHVVIDSQPQSPPYDRIALDPGTHTLEFSAPNRATESRTIAPREGTHTTIAIQLQPIAAPVAPAVAMGAPTPPGEAPAPTQLATTPVSATPGPVRTSAHDFIHSGRGGAAIAFGVLALTSFVIEAATGGASLSDKHAYDRSCNAGVCSAGTYNDGHRLAVASDVFLGVGLTTAAISTLIILTRPKYTYHADNKLARISVGAASIGGTF